jgi:molybdenum cofactor cytidylyltransferase
MPGTLRQKPLTSSATHALLLAAGSGTRFGGRKLLAPWRGGTILEASLATALNAPVAGVTLVSGHDRDEIERVARDVARRHEAGRKLAIVHAADHLDGLSASLKTGLAALPASAEAVFVFLGDMPKIPPDVPARLMQGMADPDLVAAMPLHDDLPGHPVLIRRELFPELMALSGDVGAKPVLARYTARTVFLPVDDRGVLIDIDRPEDVARLRDA